MPPFQTVLCAIDFEAGSARALAQAADLVERDHAALHLVYVDPLERPRLPHEDGDPEAVFREHVRTFINRALGADDAFGVLAPTLHEVCGRPPADGVVGTAEAIDADLVVVGSHGRRGLGHLILGSVAADVLRRSPVPVLVVPEQAERGGPGPDRPVLVGVDFSIFTGPSIRLAARLAEAYGAPLVPVHVRSLPSDAFGDSDRMRGGARPEAEVQTRTRAREALAEVVRSEGAEALVRESYVVRGAAGDRLVAAAQRTGAGVLVMGTHGRSGFDRLRLGSVAEWVVRRAPCPVLAVPPRAL